MDLQLKGKTALITGGSEGIGKGIASVLAKEGVDVAICARRMEPLEKAAAEIAKATGRKIVPIECTALVYGLGSIHCVTQQQPR